MIKQVSLRNELRHQKNIDLKKKTPAPAYQIMFYWVQNTPLITQYL